MTTLAERIDLLQRQYEHAADKRFDRTSPDYEPRVGEVLRTVALDLANALDESPEENRP